MARECDSLYSVGSIMDIFDCAVLGDGRHERGLRHSAKIVLVMMTLGFLNGNTSIRSVSEFFRCDTLDPNDEETVKIKEERKNCLLTFVELPYGIPVCSTLTRVIEKLDPLPFVIGFANFMYSLVPHDNEQKPIQIALDGKASLGARNKALTGNSFYIVNVMAAAYHLFLYQTAVGPKKAEASVIEQEIADILDGSSAVVTMDAMGTKKAILDVIFGQDSDAVLPIKRNNKNLMESCLTQIVSRILECSDSASHLVDLDDYKDSDAPVKCIDDTRCTLFFEDNHPDTADESDPGRPISEFDFFDNVYNYTGLNPGNDFATEGQLYHVKVGDYHIPMVFTHGRFERREYDLITDPKIMAEILAEPAFESWPQISNIGLVTRYRGVWVRDKETKRVYLDVSITRTPYLLTSLMTVEEFATTVRRHWAIEQAHNILDEIFREDRSTAKEGNAATNLALIRKLVFNLVVIFRAKIGRSTDSLDGFTNDMKRLAGKITGMKEFLTNRIRSPFKAIVA